MGDSGFNVSEAGSRPLQILLIEDNAGDVRLVVEALRHGRLLHRLCVAENGVEALAMLRREGAHAHIPRPDLILLDLNMPGLSGHELLDVLKSDPKFARIPVIVLTGSDVHDDVARAYSAHANCYIRKPVDLDKLLSVMQAVGNFWLSVVSLPEGRAQDAGGAWRMLLVEDNPGDARLVQEMLMRPDLEIVHVDCLSSAIDALASAAFTLALVDPGLPDSRGLETIRAIQRAAPLMPLVVLSGHDDEVLALSAIQLGAQDYVVKGSLETSALVRALRYAVQRKLVQERLDYLATHDNVTGLPNRQVFLGDLKEAIAQCHVRGHDAAVLMIAMSGLSRVNELYGHDVGDMAIGERVERMRKVLPTGAKIACTGSAEFSVILTDTHAIMDTPRLAEEVIAAIGHPGTVGSSQVYLRANVGMSLFSIDAEEPTTLLKCAETALYQAKSAGTNTFRFYSAKMNAAALERLTLENELRRALEREEFELHYQPVFDIASGYVVAAEALLRWRHPIRGLLFPSEFLDVAEQCGVILPLGEWVIQQACRTARSWPKVKDTALQIAVNVSAQQMTAGDFVAVVDRALAASMIAPSLLIVELTESIMQSERSRQTLIDLRGRGVRVAIDDFGTGFSSLAYLRRFPVDILKIDRSFLVGVIEDDRDAAIVRTIIAMARNLDLSVVAEGVESAAQLDFLRAIDCGKAQGYLLGMPFESDIFAEWVWAQAAHIEGASAI